MCLNCRRTSSLATHDPCRTQNKRTINELVRLLIASGVTQRRCAQLLSVDKKTIARKVLFLGRMAELQILEMNHKHPPAAEVQFDELETFELSKKLPLSVVILVKKNRHILGIETAQMPCRGKLAKASREKYGRRKDTRRMARKRLFRRVSQSVRPDVVIESDQNPHYPSDVKTEFPQAIHVTYKSRNAKACGFGELKEGAHDPLFPLNHTAAMFRANLACLARRTWSTTKREFGLRARMMIYAAYHNEIIAQQEEKKLGRLTAA